MKAVICKSCLKVMPAPSLTKAQLWRRVTMLAGEVQFLDGAQEITYCKPTSVDDLAHVIINGIVKSARFTLANVRHKRLRRKLDKLEAALKAWEGAT